MPTILTRPPVSSAWDPTELAGPYEPLTLREWEVAIATYGLAEPLRVLLCEALLEEATPACIGCQRWPLPRSISLFDTAVLRQDSADTLREHLLEAVVTLWQILDLPPGVIPGMLRGLLLVGLGARLRQTLDALQGRAGALPAHRELEQALSKMDVPVASAPVPPAPVQPPPRRSSPFLLHSARRVSIHPPRCAAYPVFYSTHPIFIARR